MQRRALLLGPLHLFITYALLREICPAAANTDARLAARRWIDRQEELARALRKGELSRPAWYEEVNNLAASVDVPQLLAEIQSGRIKDSGKPFMRDPQRRNVYFVDEKGARRRLTYATALFSFTPESVITPHAHKHMVSAHLVLDGKVRVRTFDRLRDEEGALVIRPTGDHVAGAGETAAMTSVKDNVHWFVAHTETALTFDVIISGLDPGRPAHVIEPVDPLGGRRLGDGSIRAPKLSFEESMRRYSPDL